MRLSPGGGERSLRGLRARYTPALPKSAASALRLPGLPGPDPGNFLYAQKVTKKAPGDPDPIVCPIGRLQGRYPVATKPPFCRWPPRNRCGAYLTSPDGPRADRHFLLRKKQIHLSRQKGDSRSRTRYPVEIRCKKSGSVAAQRQIISRPIGQNGVRGVPGGVFTRPQAGAYEANRRIAAALRPSGLLCRRGQSNSGVRGWVSPGRLSLEASRLRV